MKGATVGSIAVPFAHFTLRSLQVKRRRLLSSRHYWPGREAFLSRRPGPPAGRERGRSEVAEQSEQIGLAYHNYHSAYNYFPSDMRDKEGKALLSWRVAILPFIEEDKLYREFKLDQAWDSDHNKKLIAKMPKMYAPIRVKAKEGETFYQTFFGENALFGGKVKNPSLVAIADGSSNTGMVFEAGEPVVWTKPADMPFDEKKPLPKLGGLFDGECNVSVRWIGETSQKGADEKEPRTSSCPRTT